MIRIRKGRVIVFTMTVLLAVGLFGYYQLEVKQAQFNKDIQGLSEYELCMYAYEKFDIEMVKKMGCVNEKYKSLSQMK